MEFEAVCVMHISDRTHSVGRFDNDGRHTHRRAKRRLRRRRNGHYRRGDNFGIFSLRAGRCSPVGDE